MRTVTYTFPEIVARRTKSGSCPVCGKRVRRSQTFSETVNPFNRNEAGSPKSPEEVRTSVDEKADAWEPDFTHARCVDFGEAS